MCGLVGFTGKQPFNFTAGKLMTILMEDRGRTSVGVLLGSYMYKDMGSPQEFFKKWIFPLEKKDMRTAMIHNRAPSRGSSTKANAHPFKYEIETEDNRVVDAYLAHNGTIYNCDELCDLYGIDKFKYDTDSELLGHIITYSGFEVLTQYKGAAAFLYTREDEPDCFYVWKGASRQATDIIEEERSLFFINTKSGVYFASTSAALSTALDVKVADVQIYPDNTLTKYCQGNIISITTYDRSHIEKKPPVTYERSRDSYAYNGGRAGDHNPFTSNVKGKDVKENGKGKNKLEFTNVNREPNRKNVYKDDYLYYREGRYYVDGDVAEGVYNVATTGQLVKSTDSTWFEGVEYTPMAWLMNGYLTGDIVAYEPLYFHKGFWVENEKALVKFKDSFRNKLASENEIAFYQKDFLHPDAVHFVFSTSPSASLYVVTRNNMRYSGAIEVIPKYSRYNYVVDAGSVRYYSYKPFDDDVAVDNPKPTLILDLMNKDESKKLMLPPAPSNVIIEDDAENPNFVNQWAENQDLMASFMDTNLDTEMGVVSSNVEKDDNLAIALVEDIMSDAEQLKGYIMQINREWDASILNNKILRVLVTKNPHLTNAVKFIKALGILCQRKDLQTTIADEAPF